MTAKEAALKTAHFFPECLCLKVEPKELFCCFFYKKPYLFFKLEMGMGILCLNFIATNYK